MAPLVGEADTPDAPEPYTVPTYHGIEVFTERVVFVLDRSGSMRWPHAPGVVSRMEVARDALVRVLGELAPTARFNVLAFDRRVEAWSKGEVAADAEAVRKAAAWVRRQEAQEGAGTNTYGVLEEAFAENPGIDTIYLLSDGIPGGRGGHHQRGDPGGGPRLEPPPARPDPRDRAHAREH